MVVPACSSTHSEGSGQKFEITMCYNHSTAFQPRRQRPCLFLKKKGGGDQGCQSFQHFHLGILHVTLKQTFCSDFLVRKSILMYLPSCQLESIPRESLYPQNENFLVFITKYAMSYPAFLFSLALTFTFSNNIPIPLKSGQNSNLMAFWSIYFTLLEHHSIN